MGKKGKNKKRSELVQAGSPETISDPAGKTSCSDVPNDDHLPVVEMTRHTTGNLNIEDLRDAEETINNAPDDQVEMLLANQSENVLLSQSESIVVPDIAEQTLLADLVEPGLERRSDNIKAVVNKGSADGFVIGQAVNRTADPSKVDREPQDFETEEIRAGNLESVDNKSVSEHELKHALNGHTELPDELLKRVMQERDDLKSALQEYVSNLDRAVEEKAQVESQYRNLFGKVTQMKSTLGARLKQDTEDLAQNRIQIEELESQNSVLNETAIHAQEQVVSLTEQFTAATHMRLQSEEVVRELSDTVSNLRESLHLEQQKRVVAEEHDMITAAEWENLAIEERAARDTLRDRIHDLEEQLSAQNVAYQNLLSIVEQDNQLNSKLKQNIVELQDSHQDEMKTALAAMQSTIDELHKTHKAAQERADILKTHNNNLETEIEKFKPYEREAKEKSLLIGKLRHEAVILNEHLTKALRLLKRGSSSDSVDRQLLNNLLLSFFQLPRQDSKRFEVLKILANILAWDDVQKEQAGLVRPGSATHLLTPLSPSLGRSPPVSPGMNRASMSRRTSGIIQLQAADFMGPNKESMSDLWINFLQSEAAMNAVETTDQL